MTRQYSLAHLTVIQCPPPEMVYLAARAGYDFVSLRFIPVGTPGEPRYLPEDRFMLRRIRTALRDTGIGMLDLELARIVEDLDPKSYLPAFEAAAELGARHVISSAWTKKHDDLSYVVDSFAALCDLAKPLGLNVNLEFPTFSRLQTLAEAVAVVRAADRDNGGIMLDMLYAHFSRMRLEDLDGLPRKWFQMVHLCDAPAEIPDTREGLIHIARDARLYVGEGAIDIASVVAHLPEAPLSIELPHDERAAELGYEEHARRCLQTAKDYFDHHMGQGQFRPAVDISFS